MNPLIEALMKIQGGYRAKKFMSANEPYLQEQSDIAEYGDPNDPNQQFVGFDDLGNPIFSGGYTSKSNFKSAAESRHGYEDVEGKDVRVSDPYEGFSGAIDDVGVWGRSFGQDEKSFVEQISQTNPRGDKITSSNNFFEMVMNPYGEAPVTVSQTGIGRGSSLYGDLGSRGVGQYRDIGIGPFRLPYGTYQGPKY
jgi:hypothetical protein